MRAIKGIEENAFVVVYLNSTNLILNRPINI